MMDQGAIVALATWAWVSANLLSVYTLGALLWTAGFYGSQFPWRQYPAGRRQMELFAALACVLGPSVLGLYLNPLSGPFWSMSDDVDPVRAFARFAGILFVGVSLTRISALLWTRRFHPERAPDLGAHFTPKNATTKRQHDSMA